MFILVHQSTLNPSMIKKHYLHGLYTYSLYSLTVVPNLLTCLTLKDNSCQESTKKGKEKAAIH